MKLARKMSKKLLAVLLALVLVLVMAPGGVFAGEAEENEAPAVAVLDESSGTSIDVVVSIQLDDTGLCLAKQELSVQADLSETYGYDDVYNGEDVTALDALVAAHILMFGEDDLGDYLEVDNGMVKKIAGENALSSYFFVNGMFAMTDGLGDTVSSAVLADGDEILFYLIQDTGWWTDSVAWFVDADGDPVSEITIEAKKEFEVTLVGYMAMWAFEDVDVAEKTEPIEDAQIVLLVIDETEGFRRAEFGDGLGITDDYGILAITFDEPGKYILSAYDDSGYDMPFTAPWLEVTVTADPGGTDPGDDTGYDEALDATLAYMLAQTPEPAFGDEWTVMTLARAGYTVPSGYFEGYYNQVKAHVAGRQGKLDGNNTEYSRLILALSAIGKDATDVGGYDLTAALSDMTEVTKQGLNGAIYALIALDTCGYEVPVAENAANQATRQKLIDYILEREVSGGGFALSPALPADPDVTGTALQALAPYAGDAGAGAAISRAIVKLSELQQESGGYSSGALTGGPESIAQSVVALSALGKNPATYSDFVKETSLVEALLEYFVTGGGFARTNDGSGTVNQMATCQAAYALVAYERFLNSSNSLYDMTDMFEYIPPVNVKISLADAAQYHVLPQQTKVPYGLAARYGYSNDASMEGKITVLDSIVRMVTLVVGENEEDVNDALTVTGGLVKDILGMGGDIIGLVNNTLGEVGFSEAHITSGDRLEFFFTDPEAFWMDTYAWFEYEGDRIDEFCINAEEEFKLEVKGTWSIVWGDWGAMDVDLEDVAVVLVDEETGILGTEPLAISDEDGLVSLVFDKEGTYVLSIIDVDSMYEPFLPPWLEVIVTGDGDNGDDGNLLDYSINFASETIRIGAGFEYIISTSAVLPTKNWTKVTAVAGKTVNVKTQLDNSVKASKPTISYVYIRNTADTSVWKKVPLVRYGGYTAAKLKAAAYFNTKDCRFELGADVYGGEDILVNHSAASSMANPTPVTNSEIPVSLKNSAGKVYVQIVPASDFRSAVATLDIPKSGTENNWNSSLKIGSFIQYNGEALPAAADPKGSSVVRWIVPDTFYKYEYTTQTGAAAVYKPIVMGEQVDTDLYDGTTAVSIYIRRAENDKAAAGKQSPKFTLAKMAAAPKPKFNGVSMAVTGVSAVMEYRVERAETGEDAETAWTRATGKTIQIKEEWEGGRMYVRTAATAAKMYSLTSAAVELLPRVDILFGTGDGEINPENVFTYNVAKGTLSLKAKNAISKDFTDLKYTNKSKIEISMNGEYWVAASTAKDLRPYFDLYKETEDIKGTLYVRIAGSSKVNTSRGELLTINIGNGSINAGSGK